MGMTRGILMGGLVAAAFDPSGDYLLTVSHSGRGVFSTQTWERLARDYALAYPENGVAIGIGPIAGLALPVVELDSDHDAWITSPDGSVKLLLSSSYIEITSSTP